MPVKTRLLFSTALLVGVGACAATPRLVELQPARLTEQSLAKPDEALYQAAVTAIERRDYALALDALQAARARSPDDERVWNAMGVVYDKLGRFDLSARYYAQAQQLDPNSKVVSQNLAYSSVLQQKHAEPAALASAEAAPPAAAPAPPQAVELASAAPQPAPAAAPPRALAGVVGPAPAPRALPPASRPEPAQRFAAVSEPLARPSAPAAPAAEPAPAPAPAPRRVVAAAAAPIVAGSGPPVVRSEVRSVTLTATPPSEAPAWPEARPVVAAAEPLLTARTPAIRRLEVRPVTLAPVTLAPAPRAPAARPPSVAAAPVTPRKTVTASVQRPGAVVRTPAPTGRIVLARSSTAVTLGRPLLIVNASGRRGGAEPARLTLAGRGWTAPVSAVRTGNARAYSTIRYASRSVVIARALARTLPYRVRLESCGVTCRGVTLYVGADALRWNGWRRTPAARGRA